MEEAFLSVVETTLHGFEIVFLNEPEFSFVITHRAFPDFLYSLEDFLFENSSCSCHKNWHMNKQKRN